MSDQWKCGHATVRLIRGDITTLAVDAIVNAANEALTPGGGVCGAIHQAGGPEIARECRQLGACVTGDAVATTGGRLPARFVIHAVAPIWRGGQSGEMDLLASAYRRSLQVATQVGARTIAFPSLGTGIYGNPIGRAAPVALSTVCRFLREHESIDEVVFVLFSQADFAVYRDARPLEG